MADELGFACILDGSNVDDEGDFRPGRRAAREHGVRSPLSGGWAYEGRDTRVYPRSAACRRGTSPPWPVSPRGSHTGRRSASSAEANRGGGDAAARPRTATGARPASRQDRANRSRRRPTWCCWCGKTRDGSSSRAEGVGIRLRDDGPGRFSQRQPERGTGSLTERARYANHRVGERKRPLHSVNMHGL